MTATVEVNAYDVAWEPTLFVCDECKAPVGETCRSNVAPLIYPKPGQSTAGRGIHAPRLAMALTMWLQRNTGEWRQG
jgi:hypothetical protein